MARTLQVGAHRAARRVERAVEEQLLDPLMTVKVLDMPQVGYAGLEGAVRDVERAGGGVPAGHRGDLPGVRARHDGGPGPDAAA